MPTKKRRISHLPTNLKPQTKTEETCPSIHTADKVFRDRPKVYRECVQRLAEGSSITAIQRDLKVSWHTIAAIRSREAPVIATTKKHIAGLLGVAAQLALEKLIAAMEEGKLPNGVMPIATGILMDKYRQFEGEPTQTIEVRKKVTLEDIKGELNRLKNGDVIEAEVEE
jgi:hypothetical protein